MKLINSIFKTKAAWVLMLCILGGGYCYAQNNVAVYLENFEDNSKQEVLTGYIDEMRIVRDDVVINLGPGQITLFDFGWDRPSAMIYVSNDKNGTFTYSPPNDVELHQLMKFTNLPHINNEFGAAVFFFTIPLDLDTLAGFTRRQATKYEWEQIVIAQADAFDHLWVYLPNMLLDGLLSDSRGDYLYADFYLEDVGHVVFRENPSSHDWYRIYDIKRHAGIKIADVLGGWSPDDRPPTRRGYQPIDIYHYDIESTIETEGKMTVNCRIYYVPLLSDVSFLYFNWYYKNKVIAADDSDGKYIYPVYKKEGFNVLDERRQESGLGLVLNKPTVAGDSDYVDIQVDCKCLEKHGTLYFIKSSIGWYPISDYRDPATYSLSYNCPDKYEVISCGGMVESKEEEGRLISKFELEKPFEYVTFNVGSFHKKEMIAEGYPPVDVYLASELNALSSAEFEEYLSDEVPAEDGIAVSDTSHSYLVNVDKLKQAGTDVINSLAFFTSILGPCPFDTIKVTSIPYYGSGQGSPGVIYLSWDTFFEEDLDGIDEQLRANTVAFQWWGHLIDNETYRDTWIIAGLSDYCGLWFYQMSAKNEGAYKKMLTDYRSTIISGAGLTDREKLVGLDIEPTGSGLKSVGSKAGPIVLGRRLNSTSSIDYTPIVYYKGAYIFHMIRYIMHDYKTGSDDRFAAFLRDLTVKFKDVPITAEGLKRILEAHVGGDMTWFFDQWIYGVNIPKYIYSWEKSPTRDGKYQVTCTVEQKDVPEGFKMLVPVTVLFEGDRFIHFKVWVDQPVTEIELPLLPYEPSDFVFNTYDAVLCKWYVD